MGTTNSVMHPCLPRLLMLQNNNVCCTWLSALRLGTHKHMQLHLACCGMCHLVPLNHEGSPLQTNKKKRKQRRRQQIERRKSEDRRQKHTPPVTSRTGKKQIRLWTLRQGHDLIKKKGPPPPDGHCTRTARFCGCIAIVIEKKKGGTAKGGEGLSTYL